MARKTNENSTRQLAFKRLNDLTSIGRKEAVDILIDEFDIKRPYAMTIYQQHRNKQKEDGAYTTVFVIRDTKDNKPTDPFVSVNYVLSPGKTDDTTLEDAIETYCIKQNSKVELAKELTYPKKDVDSTDKK